MGRDRFIWEGCSTCLFSAKAFRLSFATKWPTVPWRKSIWKAWIPKKINCFMWKLFNNGIPTQLRIQRVGIYLASKCLCCANPKVESLQHLFFLSDMADVGWSYVEWLCGLRRPLGIASLIRLLFEGDAVDYLGALKVSISCCMLWEIWKWRNACLFGDKSPPLSEIMHRWYCDLRVLIQSKFTAPISSHIWKSYDSCDKGCVVSAALIKRLDCLYGAAIFKPADSCSWKVLYMKVPMSDGLGELLAFLRKVIDVGRKSGLLISKVCCSNVYMQWLAVMEDEVPWNELCRVRSFRHKFRSIFFVKSCPLNTNGALAVAEALSKQLAPILQVPWVSKAIACERQNLRFLCQAANCQHPDVLAVLPTQSCDDISVGSRPVRWPD